jgi:predicted LPLAT superfamily acyltransferase
LGRRAAGWLLWVVCGYFVAFARPLRRASRQALARLGQPTDLGTVHRHFVTFARVTLDRIAFLTGKSQSLEVHLHGHEHVMALAGAGQGGLLLGSHLGSFEAMRTLAGQYDVPLLVLADFANARRVNALLERLAPGLKLRLLELDPDEPLGLLAVKEAINRGELVAVLGDRATKRSGRDAVVPFAGATAAFPVGPFALAHVLACPVYFVCALYSEPGRYDVHCVPLTERVVLPRQGRAEALETEVRRYAATLEGFARQAPLNWFNYFPFWTDD